MRIVRYEQGGRVGVGVREGDRILPTGHTDMLDFIRAGIVQRAGAGAALPAAECRLLAPIPSPGKLIFSGLNYRSHTDENPSAVLPTYPHCFAKLPSSVIGPDKPIVLPAEAMRVDYEVELAIVIGKTARGVTRNDALDHVFGYTVVNDVSARDVQFRDNQMATGKGFDTFCPLGPEIVLTDEIPDPQRLHVASYVNGERRQSSPTSDMLFDVATLIAFYAQHITFYPGDIIATGTPAGVGTFRNPPLFLRPGDVVTVEVDAIGRLTNPVTAGWEGR
ncbi:MAG TPA: fumarylacetoacetate hydrolase family protein [Chloroflexota bacterium]|nr:fumarylacetoacetate hydrolase family protein [Chloroflexota bacterium]